MNDLSNVTDITSRLMPIGSIARHPVFGLCEVVSVKNRLREIRFVDLRNAAGTTVDGEAVEFCESINTRRGWAHVRDLSPAKGSLLCGA